MSSPPTTIAASGEPWDRRDRTLGLAAVTLAVGVFSWGFIIVKAVDLPAASLSFWRLTLGSAFLAAVATVLRIPWPRQWKPLLGAGLAFGAHQLLFIAATKATSIAIVTLLGAAQPLLVAAVSHRTVGERVPPRLYGSALLALLGVGVVVHANLGDASRSLYGDVLAIINVFAFTVYFLFAKRARSCGAPTVTFTAGFLTIALLVVAPATLLGALGGGASASAGQVLPISGRDAALLLLLALGPGNGHLLLNWAHPRVTAALSSLVLSMIPLLSGIWAHLLFGEPLSWRHGAGMLLVAIAVETGRRIELRQIARCGPPTETPIRRRSA